MDSRTDSSTALEAAPPLVEAEKTLNPSEMPAQVTSNPTPLEKPTPMITLQDSGIGDGGNLEDSAPQMGEALAVPDDTTLPDRGQGVLSAPTKPATVAGSIQYVHSKENADSLLSVGTSAVRKDSRPSEITPSAPSGSVDQSDPQRLKPGEPKGKNFKFLRTKSGALPLRPSQATSTGRSPGDTSTIINEMAEPLKTAQARTPPTYCSPEDILANYILA